MKSQIVNLVSGSLSLLAVLVVLSDAAAAVEPCPPAGARYISDNFVVRSEIISLGSGMPDPTLGCKWRRVSDNQEIWLNMGATITPLAGAAAKPAESLAGAPARGVYECDAPINVGGMMMGSPQTSLMFGLIDGRRYRDFDGGTGNYRFDSASAELTMTDGPLKGTRYRRTAATLFKPLDRNGAEGSIRCILAKNKSLSGRW